jgi:4-hydroxy-tetrahydrodipicolinate reductase
MVNVIVSGAAGRMGRRICALTHEHQKLALAGAFEVKGHADIGKDIGELIGVGNLGIEVAEGIDKVIDSGDVIIDFTHPDATLENLKAASAKGKAMVIGTTGFTKEALDEARDIARKIPCVLSFNMSLGINLLLKVLKDIAGALGDDYDVEIIEAHHRLKKDAPSGTALMMAREIAEALCRNVDADAVYARKGMIGERSKKEIGIQTVRAGDIVGEHTVLFGGLGERVEVTHRASSRDTFARGAMRAALWIADKKPGLYNMQDVLGIG